MSGGHFNYMYSTIEDMYGGNLLDPDLNEMLKDFIELLHDLEWFESGDYDEETYFSTVEEFKKKWFNKKCAKCTLVENMKKIKELSNL
jgi:hypothetical protein